MHWGDGWGFVAVILAIIFAGIVYKAETAKCGEDADSWYGLSVIPIIMVVFAGFFAFAFGY